MKPYVKVYNTEKEKQLNLKNFKELRNFVYEHERVINSAFLNK